MMCWFCGIGWADSDRAARSVAASSPWSALNWVWVKPQPTAARAVRSGAVGLPSSPGGIPARTSSVASTAVTAAAATNTATR
ncbi:hypothetical protein [Streptomyces sp. NPDC101150]|uniref:hypothetical protein n=1 Tax=Streptomyces sp. NPDC101150 TaxID=3366114 RepID=UPI0037F67CD6